MSYIDKNLMNGEEVIHRAHLHWIIFLSPLFFLVVGICLVSAGPSGSTSQPIGTVFILVGIVMAISALINYFTSEFGVTNKRIIAKVGFVRRRSLEVLLSKIEGIQVDQGIIGRLLNYGSVVISGTGGSKDPFKKIGKPLIFRKSAQEQIDGGVPQVKSQPKERTREAIDDSQETNWFEKAVSLHKADNYGQAIEAYSKALALDSGNAMAYYNRAVIYNKLGKTENALKDLKAAARLGHQKSQSFLKSKGMTW
jgi:tetratricopeptide (TPR) repeat protein